MRSATRGDDGFSLLELLVVCALLAVAAAVGMGLWSSAAESYRLSRATAELRQALVEARAAAVLEQLPRQVVLDVPRNRFSSAPLGRAPLRWRSLPAGVRIARSPRRPIAFFSRGYAVPAGSITLESRLWTTRLVVSGSGRVRVERLD